MGVQSSWSFSSHQGAPGRLPRHSLKPINCQRKRGVKKKKVEKAQVQHLGFLRGLGRHRDALGVRVFVERNPCGKGLGDEQGEMSPHKKQPPAISWSKPAPSLEFTPALHSILGGWQESEKGESR